MFIGHYGVALALKKADPKLSLGTLFVGAQLVDILWGMFILLGWERARVDPGFTAMSPFQFLYYPISHSLVAGVFWGIVAAAVYYTWPTKDTSHRRRGALVLGIAVLAHWFLDLVVHIPDLPLASDSSRKVGLGLWDSIGGTHVVEFGLLAIGAWLYAHTKTKRHPLRTKRLVILILVLAAFERGQHVGTAADQYDCRRRLRHRLVRGHGLAGVLGRPGSTTRPGRRASPP